MECNRDEAIRARTIAEGKIEKKDFVSAKKFAMKAQSLYPGLEGLSQMLTTLDVYISAENKISGEVDWYGVLGVNPSADDETVKKQYRKLALILHPDKNKAVGADGAFKLLSEAWSLLSDKAKRLAYNQRRSSLGYQQKVQSHTSGPSVPPRTNGFHNTASRPKANTASFPPKKVPNPPNQRTDTFWTLCNRCKMYYEYLKVYLNSVLVCPNCHETFTASETSPPFSHYKPSNVTSRQQQSSSARPPSVYPLDPSFAAKESMKRQRDELHHAGGSNHIYNSFRKGEAPVKKSRVGDEGNHFGPNMAYRTAMGNNGFGPTTFASGSTKSGFEGSKVGGFPGSLSKPDIRELTPVETRNMLIAKARRDILAKLKSVDAEKGKVKETKKAKEMKGHNMNGNVEATTSKAKNSNASASGDVMIENPSTASMTVPDPDFHDFDLDRTENSFGDNEVWAAYDDDDGMPRFYALISKVMSRKPFKVRLSWLNSKTNEFSHMNWVGSGFYKTCGEFRIGKYELYKSINSFSHKVKWSKDTRGVIHILPTKGDVWALYRNWSPDWNEHTPDEVIHKYDMVLVLEDYNEEQGMSVAPLVKVAGFRTIFHRDVDPEKVIRVPKEEMFRFSHRVPQYLLTGDEAQNAPKGCQELDPAATPLELLQLPTDGRHA